MLDWLKRLSRLNPGASTARTVAGAGEATGQGGRLIREGDAHLSARRLGEAAKCYRRAIGVDPGSTDAHVKLATTLIEQGRFGDAEAHLQSAISLDPRRADAHHRLGAAHIAQGRADEGIRQFELALELEADFEAAYRDLCLAQFQRGRVEDAERVVAAGLAACPESAELHFYRGNLHNHAGNLDSAVACYRHALSLRPDFPEARLNLGRIHTRQGRPDEALAEFSLLRSVRPDSVDAHVAIGDVLSAQDRLDEAAACFRRAVELAPESAAANERLGWTLLKRGMFDEAFAPFADAMALAPDNADIHTGLGLALERRGRRDEAIGHYKRALALNPDHINGRLSLGNALLARGSRDEALALFREVVRLQPHHSVGHVVNALSGANTDRAPRAYVEALFDDYSGRFDTELVEVLKYNVPQLLADALRELAQPKAHAWDVIDLGCGTGLAGSAIAPYARSIVGVDLSANMLARARARNVYQRLEQGDLLTLVEGEPPSAYDLVLAADVLIYLGRLDELAAQVRRILRPGGLFGFSVEAAEAGLAQAAAPEDTPDFRLVSSGRYAQSRGYLARLALENHFEVCSLTPIDVRLDAGNPVPGYLALWCAGDQAQGG